MLNINAAVRLSQPEFILVCPGQQLSLTCTPTEADVLRWIVTPPGTTSTLIPSRLVSVRRDPLPLPVKVNNITVNINISRQSSSPPVISTLSIDVITADFNGTEIVCEVENSSAMTVIRVIERKHHYQNPI